MPKILLIEDEAAIRRVLIKILTEENNTYQVEEAVDGLEGVEILKEQDFDLVLCDIKMPKMDGVEVLEAVKKIKPEIPFVMISGHGDLDTAVNTMRLGAFDYISKPPDLNRLLNTVRNALDKKELIVENTQLKKKISKNYEMIGESEAIKKIKEIVEKVAPTDARVLITGPNGTGKELVAHWLHQKSDRSNAPMVEVNCAAIPSELIESELFGHEKGSFTSAIKQRIGKFEQAGGGTLFLDEIGDMSLSAQAKVLRALQENRISRVGGDKDIQVDVRILAATLPAPTRWTQPRMPTRRHPPRAWARSAGGCGDTAGRSELSSQRTAHAMCGSSAASPVALMVPPDGARQLGDHGTERKDRAARRGRG